MKKIVWKLDFVSYIKDIFTKIIKVSIKTQTKIYPHVVYCFLNIKPPQNVNTQ